MATNLIKKIWGQGDTSNIPDLLPYGIKGWLIAIQAKEINPTAGVYDFETWVGEQIDNLIANDLQGGIIVTFGPVTPDYKMAQVGTFTTAGGNDDGPYPYYFNPVYISWYYDFYQRLCTYIAGMSDLRKSVLQFIQVAEGSTGDTGPYKGTPVDYNWDGQTSISDADWSDFRHAAWAQFSIYNAPNASFCKMLLNPGNDNEEIDYQQDTYPDAYFKNGITSHQLGFDGETVVSERNVIDRGEMQGFWESDDWQEAPLQLNWALFCSFIALNLDIPNAPSGFINQAHGDNTDLWDFGQRYIGEDITAGIGMIAFRDMPDMASDRFPVVPYGPVIDPARQGAYNSRVNKINTDYADKPSYQAWLLNNAIVTYFNEDRGNDIAADLAFTGAQWAPGNPYLNSFGIGMLLNYEMFLYQYDPNNTSVGGYNVGPMSSTDLYGHYTRRTDFANGKDEMFLFIDEQLVGDASYTLTLRITYLDTGVNEWSLNYRDEYGPVAAFTNTNTGTGEWIQRTVTISNLQGKAYTHETDFSLKYESGDDVHFAMVEFMGIVENSTIDTPPTVTIDSPTSPVTIYLPTNSVDVTASAMPSYLHSVSLIEWTYIAGPPTYTISNPATADTTFSNLVAGSYRFRITVTQDDSQTAYSDIIINVVPTQGGVKYILRYKNRQEDIRRVELLPKDYSGIDAEIEGSDTPFKYKYQSGDGSIYSPIRASEATIQFWTDGNIPIETFYNDDDTFWKVLFYGQQIKDEAEEDVLLWTGFLQMDNSGEELQDRPHVISLNANDNLGLLKNIALPTPDDTQRYEGILLTELFAIILQQTSLTLDTEAYLNVFENATEDRGDDETVDFLQQTAVYTNNLQNSDGGYRKCFDILNEQLNTFRATLYQAHGTWVITRQGEFRLFEDAQVPGTLYNSDFEVQESITLDPIITIGRNEDILPINENQFKRILRPYQFVKKTFSYNQPDLLIIQSVLALPEGAEPYDSRTEGDLFFEDYSLTTYFPDWRRHAGDTSYLEVVTDVLSENEVERYIVTPGSTGIYGGITFNNIPVSANDQFDFMLQFRTFADTGQVVRFYVSFALYDTNGEFYYIAGVNFTNNSSQDLHWTGPVSSLPVPFIGVETAIPDTVDNSQWTPWQLTSLLTESGAPLIIPADGILLVQVLAANGPDNNTHPDLLWNNITISFKNAVNAQTTIISQVHNQSQNITAKNNSDTKIEWDDSPLNTINGTLFRVPLVNFASPVDDLYFFKTNRWHRANIAEAWRLNQIQTFDELFIQRKTRTIVEGDWFGLRYLKDGAWEYLSLKNIMKINFLESLNFIFGIVEFDDMAAEFTATLYECFDDGETDSDLANTYTFNYIYKST